MSTYDTLIPVSSVNGNALASTLAGLGVPFSDLSGNSSGNFSITSNDSNLGSLLDSAGITTDSAGYGTLANVFGNADTSNEGASSSATTGTPSDKTTAFFASYGADLVAIVIGLLLVAASIFALVKS